MGKQVVLVGILKIALDIDLRSEKSRLFILKFISNATYYKY